jgi:hypothetical protein
MNIPPGEFISSGFKRRAFLVRDDYYDYAAESLENAAKREADVFKGNAEAGELFSRLAGLERVVNKTSREKAEKGTMKDPGRACLKSFFKRNGSF